MEINDSELSDEERSRRGIIVVAIGLSLLSFDAVLQRYFGHINSFAEIEMSATAFTMFLQVILFFGGGCHISHNGDMLFVG